MVIVVSYEPGARSSTIQKAMLNIFILNGVMFLGSVLILETFYNTPAHRAFGCSYAVKQEKVRESLYAKVRGNSKCECKHRA